MTKIFSSVVFLALTAPCGAFVTPSSSNGRSSIAPLGIMNGPQTGGTDASSSLPDAYGQVCFVLVEPSAQDYILCLITLTYHFVSFCYRCRSIIPGVIAASTVPTTEDHPPRMDDHTYHHIHHLVDTELPTARSYRKLCPLDEDRSPQSQEDAGVVLNMPAKATQPSGVLPNGIRTNASKRKSCEVI